MQLDQKFEQKVTHLQRDLIERTKSIFGQGTVSSELEDAFYQTPRHLFANHFQSSETAEWVHLTDENLAHHIDSLYRDFPISIYRNSAGELASTISQPSLVLFMIHLLDLKPNHRVFELGGGSGWHSALMSRLLSPEGSVDSIEIIEDLIEPARKTAALLGLDNLHVHHGDGSHGYAERAPFDCGVFTASSPELPQVFFEQIKQGGLLEFVLKLPNQHDLLALLRRTERGFASELLMPCSFVPVTGSQTCPVHDVVVLEENSIWTTLRSSEPHSLYWYELGIDSAEVEAFLQFCNNTLNGFTHFDSFEDNELRSSSFLCGLIDNNTQSIILMNESALLTFGNSPLTAVVKQYARQWIDSGKPNTEDLQLEILPLETPIEEARDKIQWIFRSKQSLYCWSPCID